MVPLLVLRKIERLEKLLYLFKLDCETWVRLVISFLPVGTVLQRDGEVSVAVVEGSEVMELVVNVMVEVKESPVCVTIEVKSLLVVEDPRLLVVLGVIENVIERVDDSCVVRDLAESSLIGLTVVFKVDTSQ